MPSLRIIACLDVRDGVVVKGVKFKDHRLIGDPIDLARRYCEEGIDELVFYDIAASTRGESFSPELVRQIARTINIPFCVAGGIKCVTDARNAIQAGADKISINSMALLRPELITEIAQDLGSQAVIVGVDVKEGQVYRLTGSQKTSQTTNREVLDWCLEAQQRGAGEIVLNCMDSDGTQAGTNIELLKKIQERLSIPLVASGGIGSVDHFDKAFRDGKVSAVLAASIFHDRVIEISDLKNQLAHRGLEIRK